jgi:hypothetical protein
MFEKEEEPMDDLLLDRYEEPDPADCTQVVTLAEVQAEMDLERMQRLRADAEAARLRAQKARLAVESLRQVAKEPPVRYVPPTSERPALILVALFLLAALVALAVMAPRADEPAQPIAIG